MKRIALLVVVALVLSGCYDILPPMFLVANYTGRTIVIEARDPDGGVKFMEEVEPGDLAEYSPAQEGCESRPWLAKTESGEILAQIPGGCVGHVWRIRGPNDFTYE